MIYIGNYVSKRSITTAKWIPGSLQMMVLTGKTVSVICQPTVAKMGLLVDEVESL